MLSVGVKGSSSELVPPPPVPPVGRGISTGGGVLCVRGGASVVDFHLLCLLFPRRCARTRDIAMISINLAPFCEGPVVSGGCRGNQGLGVKGFGFTSKILTVGFRRGFRCILMLMLPTASSASGTLPH